MLSFLLSSLKLIKKSRAFSISLLQISNSRANAEAILPKLRVVVLSFYRRGNNTSASSTTIKVGPHRRASIKSFPKAFSVDPTSEPRRPAPDSMCATHHNPSACPIYAMHVARLVFPLPEGPCNNIPHGNTIPSDNNFAALVIG